MNGQRDINPKSEDRATGSKDLGIARQGFAGRFLFGLEGFAPVIPGDDTDGGDVPHLKAFEPEGGVFEEGRDVAVKMAAA